jgi:hypothetical protein
MDEMISETDLLKQLERIIMEQQQGVEDKEKERADYSPSERTNEHVLFQHTQQSPGKKSTQIFYNVDNIDPPEPIFSQDKVTTGLFEDLRLGSVLWIERVSLWAQLKVSGFLQRLIEFRDVE